MRRFIAYLLASMTILLGVGVAFEPVATSINADLSFRDGRELTFKLEHKDGTSFEEGEEPEAAHNYAATIETRLKAFSVTDYNINVKGNDTISVTCTADNATEYGYISKILCTSSKISFATCQDSTPVEEKNYSWHDNQARIEYDGTTAIVVMPIPEEAKTDIQTMYDKAKEEEGGDDPDPKESKNEGEDKPKESIVLWLDRQEDDNYKDAKEKQDTNVLNKVLKVMNTENFYYGEDKNAFQIKFVPSSDSQLDVKNAYREALCYCNILNASATDYKCVEVNNIIVPASFENLIDYGSHAHIAMSATFISLLVAFITLATLLVLIYRITSLAVISTSTLTTFLTLTLFTIFRPLFNISALVGLIIVMGASVFSGVAYNNYLREEVYKGRNLKKANYEASKKTTMLTVDASVIMALLGVILYFVGGTTVASLGTILIFGAVVNVVINTFILKGLMWLITNNTKTQDHYKLFNFKSKYIPNLAKEEKPNYVSPFAKKDLTKKKAIGGIIASVLLVASIAGIITFTAIGASNGVSRMFNTGNYYAPTNEIFLSYDRPDGSYDPIPSLDEFKTNVLDKITNDNKPLNYDKEITNYTYTYYTSIEDRVDRKVFCYVITVNEKDVNTLTYSYDNSDPEELVDAVTTALKDTGYGSETVIARTNEAYNLPSNALVILGANLIVIAASTVYLWIRYRGSRAVSVLILSASGTIITIGVMTLTRIIATPVMAIAASITTAFSLFFALYLLHKDKDLMRDERLKDLNTRKAALKSASDMAFIPATTFIIMSITSLIACLGVGSLSYLSIFISSSLGLIVVGLMFLTLYVPLANALDEQFAKVKLPDIRHKKKKNNNKDDHELSEAIFIGIND